MDGDHALFRSTRRHWTTLSRLGLSPASTAAAVTVPWSESGASWCTALPSRSRSTAEPSSESPQNRPCRFAWHSSLIRRQRSPHLQKTSCLISIIALPSQSVQLFRCITPAKQDTRSHEKLPPASSMNHPTSATRTPFKESASIASWRDCTDSTLL